MGALQKALEEVKKEKALLVKPISEEEFRKNFPKNIIVDTLRKNDFEKNTNAQALELINVQPTASIQETTYHSAAEAIDGDKVSGVSFVAGLGKAKQTYK